jgi:phenylacetic acid degradation operon negative regulatory protein
LNAFFEKYEKRKYLKQSFKRMRRRGLIEQKNGFYQLSKKGILFLKRFVFRSPTFRSSANSWDGKWRLISFDVPLSHNHERNLLRTLLKEFNFYPLHKSVWICPNQMTEKFWKLIVDYELDKYCKVMLVEIVEGDEDLRNYFFKKKSKEKK